MDNDYPLFEQFIIPILELNNISKETLLQSAFKLYEYGSLSVYYAPFDYINHDAKVVIIGISPGFTQMEIAYQEVQRSVNNGLPTDAVLANVKQAASFAGSMRANLLSMLDELGLHTHLGLSESSDLFDEGFKLLHTTSAIRYPVFIDGKNYAGQKPKMYTNPQLRDYVVSLLGYELGLLSKALIIPLGKSVDEAVRFASLKKSITLPYVLWNFPHPSGANGHRKIQFDEHKKAFKQTILSWVTHSMQ